MQRSTTGQGAHSEDVGELSSKMNVFKALHSGISVEEADERLYWLQVMNDSKETDRKGLIHIHRQGGKSHKTHQRLRMDC